MIQPPSRSAPQPAPPPLPASQTTEVAIKKVPVGDNGYIGLEAMARALGITPERLHKRLRDKSHGYYSSERRQVWAWDAGRKTMNLAPDKFLFSQADYDYNMSLKKQGKRNTSTESEAA
jgi:hypothetical protein